MNHLILAPVILPAILAPLIVLVMRHELSLQRIFSVVGSLALLVIALLLFVQAATGEIQVYEMGNWPAPFGIVLVLDRLSALMLMLTAILGVAVVLYAIGSGWDARGKHFHALFQFQLMGINGAFLTGDAFNLFVFFEILLIASYGLMIHGGGKLRLRAGVQYVVFNLAGSALFLFALGTLYGMTGTLNMADMAGRVAALPEGDAALLRVGAVLLLLVFAVKAAVVPVHFWLPNTYTHAPAPVAALFAIMTKVGAYAILRMYTLVFGPDMPMIGTLIADWLIPAAVVTVALGMLGVLGSAHLGRLISFSVIGSMGTLFLAIGLFTPEATTAALYYMVHSTFAAAVLFLIADLVVSRRGAAGAAITAAAPIAQNGLIAALFFVAAIGMAGLPPLSGFIGKLLILDAARDSGHMVVIFTAILVTSLIAVVGFARAGSTVFWKAYAVGGEPAQVPTQGALPVVVTGGLAATMLLMVILAGPLTGYIEATSAQLYNRSGYVEAVLPPMDAQGTPIPQSGEPEGQGPLPPDGPQTALPDGEEPGTVPGAYSGGEAEREAEEGAE
ncbi:monovalent cation/H+ antiporter subunit D [Plastorhodobacter daqingensis]|uniref:Monovalent cation/H+ antiporter subunit D n=1 Tax=Plastorhodobacter daqingensis TaxID=1387281 RepID=A0ABW2UQN1_9RHOB